MKVRIFTFGCKVNQYESQWLREAFASRGDEISEEDDFDLALVNTCCVTAKAEKDARILVRRLLREGKMVQITGCIPEKPEGFCLRDYSDAEILRRHKVYSLFPKADRKISSFSGHTRAFVKIEDGCNNRCAYCIVPLVRGPVRTRREKEILGEAAGLISAGYRELVLTGVNLGSYGEETGTSLSRLLPKLAENPLLKRIRLSSIELPHITPLLLSTLSQIPAFCPSFHIPLQSGSDRILSLMGRSYCAAEFLDTVFRIKDLFPSALFTTDVMVAFPGESDSDIEATCDIIRKVGFFRCHLFPFSPREGTRAYTMPGHIPALTRKERMARVQACAEEVKRRIALEYIGKEHEVLFEQSRNGIQTGFTENYLLAGSRSSLCRKGEIVRVRLLSPPSSEQAWFTAEPCA